MSRFNFSTGSGFYHPTRSGSRTSRCPRLHRQLHRPAPAGRADLNRLVEALHAERDRVVEHRDLLDSEVSDKRRFDGKLGLSRTVFPYVENHNFYVEHWAHSVIWRKMRAIGEILVGARGLRQCRRRVPAQALRGGRRLCSTTTPAGLSARRRAARATGRRSCSGVGASSRPSRAGAPRRRSASRRRS
ncbi:MAG: hypothetical protein R2734_09485 [Nocardioides sp.]